MPFFYSVPAQHKVQATLLFSETLAWPCPALTQLVATKFMCLCRVSPRLVGLPCLLGTQPSALREQRGDTARKL